MAKQIIVLNNNSDGTFVTYQMAFWFSIASGVQTQASGSVWTGASAAENTAIQNGTVKEEVKSFVFPIGTPSATIKSFIQQAWTDRNSQLNGIGTAQYYGVYLDSVTGWSA